MAAGMPGRYTNELVFLHADTVIHQHFGKLL